MHRIRLQPSVEKAQAIPLIRRSGKDVDGAVAHERGQRAGSIGGNRGSNFAARIT